MLRLGTIITLLAVLTACGSGPYKDYVIEAEAVLSLEDVTRQQHHDILLEHDVVFHDDGAPGFAELQFTDSALSVTLEATPTGKGGFDTELYYFRCSSASPIGDPIWRQGGEARFEEAGTAELTREIDWVGGEFRGGSGGVEGCAGIDTRNERPAGRLRFAADDEAWDVVATVHARLHLSYPTRFYTLDKDNSGTLNIVFEETPAEDLTILEREN